LQRSLNLKIVEAETVTMAAVVPGYSDRVFINCPFDKEYMPILHAITYTIYRCGLIPQIALNEDDASDSRLDKIIRFIRGCKYGVHDISRTEANENGFPRFNMPFELGLFFGAKRFGANEQMTKSALVFEKTKYSYIQCISDLSGVDTKAHYDDPAIAIRKIRDWLSTTAPNKTTLPGYQIILKEYLQFKAKLPSMARRAGFDVNDIAFNDFCKMVEWWVNDKLPTT
jgi:hypothetical protein